MNYNIYVFHVTQKQRYFNCKVFVWYALFGSPTYIVSIIHTKTDKFKSWYCCKNKLKYIRKVKLWNLPPKYPPVSHKKIVGKFTYFSTKYKIFFRCTKYKNKMLALNPINQSSFVKWRYHTMVFTLLRPIWDQKLSFWAILGHISHKLA